MMRAARDDHPHRAARDDHADLLVRALLGIYLLVHFAQLLPWAAEVFSDAGMLPAGASPFFGAIPNPLFVWRDPLAAQLVLCAGIAAAAALALGVRERVAAACAWLVWMWLYTRNPLIANPAMPFIGLLLIAHAALGRPVRGLIFALLAVAYSYSGITKLIAPSWIDGSALVAVLENPLARPSPLRDMLLALPAPAMAWLSYGVLALEVAFAPLSLSPRLRPLLWLAMVGMHLGILLLVDFADLTLGMLIAHAYAFDPRWLRQAQARWASVRDAVRLRRGPRALRSMHGS